MSFLHKADDDYDRGLDERAGTGKTTVVCRFKRHPMHPNDRICDLCGATVDRHRTGIHERNHFHESEWEDKTERLEALLEDVGVQMAEIRGEWNTLCELLRPGIERMMNKPPWGPGSGPR